MCIHMFNPGALLLSLRSCHLAYSFTLQRFVACNYLEKNKKNRGSKTAVNLHYPIISLGGLRRIRYLTMTIKIFSGVLFDEPIYFS